MFAMDLNLLLLLQIGGRQDGRPIIPIISETETGVKCFCIFYNKILNIKGITDSN